MSVRARFGAWTGTLAALVMLSGCGFPEQNRASPLSDDEIPTGLRAGPNEIASTAPNVSETATIWLVDGDGLVPARHDVAPPASVESITSDLLTGPTESERQQGLRSALPDPSVVEGVALAQGIATIDLASPFGEISPDDQLLAIGQFVLTLTDARGVGRVEFEVEGTQIAVPLPNGETSDLPVFREQYLDLVATPTS